MTNILTSYHFCGLVHEALILLECFLILSSDHRCIFQCFLKFFGCGVWAIGQVLCPDRSLRHTWDEIRRIEKMVFILDSLRVNVFLYSRSTGCVSPRRPKQLYSGVAGVMRGADVVFARCGAGVFIFIQLHVHKLHFHTLGAIFNGKQGARNPILCLK